MAENPAQELDIVARYNNAADRCLVLSDTETDEFVRDALRRAAAAFTMCMMEHTRLRSQPVPLPLSPHAADTMREFKGLVDHGARVGKRRSKTMRLLEAYGLAKRVEKAGKIVDWEITERGRQWRG